MNPLRLAVAILLLLLAVVSAILAVYYAGKEPAYLTVIWIFNGVMFLVASVLNFALAVEY